MIRRVKSESLSLDLPHGSFVDAHAHLGAFRHAAFLGASGTLEELVRAERAAGVSGVSLTTTDEADNEALLAAVACSPLETWAFLWARPGVGARGLGDLIARHAGLARGLKVHASLERVPLDDPGWDEVFGLASDLGLVVMVHTGRWQEVAGYPLALARARAFPRVRFLLSHAGGDTAELCLGAARAVAEDRLENVFFDTAGLREAFALERALRLLGPERYLMGSDFPLAPPAMYVAQHLSLSIPDAWKERLLGGNARELLGAAAPRARGPEETRAAAPRSSVEVARGDAGAEATILVTGAGGPIGVNLTRSLRLARRRYRLVGTDANPLHAPLAIVDRCHLVPHSKAAGYAERLEEIVRAERVDLVVPTHPVEVRALSALRDRFGARLFLPPHGAILLGQDKAASYERFLAAGVPVPRSIRIEGPEDVRRAFDELGPPPVWFRGSGVPGEGIGVASLPCREAAHAEAWVAHHSGWGRFLASEYLPGRNLTFLSIWGGGTLFARQSRERLEYVIPHVSPSGITGAPAVSRTILDPEVSRIGEAAVRAVCGGAPHGIFFVDLKGDAAGRPRVTEINCGRFGTTLHFYTVAGFNFPELAVELALGRPPAAPRLDPVPEGLYWIRTLDCGPVLARRDELERPR
jgi:predicted TIM-barrel fold metal-dependent hydrolase/carbamoylphosphate synthase large subunit